MYQKYRTELFWALNKCRSLQNICNMVVRLMFSCLYYSPWQESVERVATSGVCSSRTVHCNVLDLHAFYVRHETEHGENGEAREKTCETINNWNYDRVSGTTKRPVPKGRIYEFCMHKACIMHLADYTMCCCYWLCLGGIRTEDHATGQIIWRYRQLKTCVTWIALSWSLKVKEKWYYIVLHPRWPF